MRALYDAIVGADDAAAAGDHRRVLELLDARVVHRADELQSLARRATSWLAIGDVHAPPPFDATLTLAALCARFSDRFGARDAIVPGATWPHARIREVVDRAEEWLKVM